MIAGVGTDIVDVPAFRRQLGDTASSFVAATFTASERRACEGRASADPAIHLAARFAAKEAFIKAWSSAFFGSEPQLGTVDLREIEVCNDPWGRPSLRLTGAVKAALGRRFGAARTHLSLSHDGPTAVAFVVLENSDS